MTPSPTCRRAAGRSWRPDGSIDTILKAADLISDTRKAFAKIENLERSHKDLADALALDRRVRELEAGLREARAEIKLEAVKETQSIVNSVQGQLYRELREISVTVERLSGDAGAGRALPPPG